MIVTMSKIKVFDTDLRNKIATMLYDGIAPVTVSAECGCTVNVVYDLKNSHKFATVCYNLAYQELMTVGAKAAVDCLIGVVKDNMSTRAIKVSAADKLLHYTGLRVTEQGLIEKSPGNMTQKEIQDRLQQLQIEASSRAKVLDTTIIDTTCDVLTDELDINDLL